jgi:hypothetical protein
MKLSALIQPQVMLHLTLTCTREPPLSADTDSWPTTFFHPTSPSRIRA